MLENKLEIPKKETLETPERRMLAKLDGFELGMEDSLVPKDTIFSLWTNVSRSKT
jgi:hypothetical protein